MRAPRPDPAQTMFKDITEANEILSDKTKRSRFDESNERGDEEFDPSDEGHGHSHGGGGFGGFGGGGGGPQADLVRTARARAHECAAATRAS